MRYVFPSLGLIALASPVLAQSDEAAVAGAAIGGILGLIIAILIGAVIGWIASKIVKGGGSGFWMNVLIGIGGSLIASHLLPAVGISLGGAIGGFIAAVIGAVLLIFVVGLIRK